jgi:hypothetical protein
MTGLPQNGRHRGEWFERVRVETGHENNRGVGGRRILAQLAHDRVSVEDWHDEIEENRVGVYAAGKLVGLEPVRSCGDAIPGSDRRTEKCQMVDVVVND